MVFIMAVAFRIITSLNWKQDPVSGVFNLGTVRSLNEHVWRVGRLANDWSCLVKKCWIKRDECAGACLWCRQKFHVWTFLDQTWNSSLSPTSQLSRHGSYRILAVSKIEDSDKRIPLRLGKDNAERDSDDENHSKRRFPEVLPTVERSMG